MLCPFGYPVDLFSEPLLIRSTKPFGTQYRCRFMQRLYASLSMEKRLPARYLKLKSKFVKKLKCPLAILFGHVEFLHGKPEPRHEEAVNIK